MGGKKDRPLGRLEIRLTPVMLLLRLLQGTLAPGPVQPKALPSFNP